MTITATNEVRDRVERGHAFMSRDQVMEAFRPYAGLEMRHVPEPKNATVIYDGNTMAIRPSRGAHLLEFNELGAANMLHRVRIPETMVAELSPNTFQTAMNELLHKRDRFTMVTKEGRIVDIISYREKESIPIERVLTTVDRAMPVQGYNRVMLGDKETVQLEVIGERTEPVVTGDLVRAGVMIRFSPLGITEPYISGYGLRLECTNGMCSEITTASYSFGGGGSGEGDDMWHWFRQNIRRAYNSLDKIVAAWRRMTEEHIEPRDRALVIAELIKQAALPPEVAETVRSMALEHPPETNWDAVNLITYASSHLLTAPKQVIRAQETATRYASATEHRHVCPVCRRER